MGAGGSGYPATIYAKIQSYGIHLPLPAHPRLFFDACDSHIRLTKVNVKSYWIQKIKIIYTPENIAGAEKYLISNDVVISDNVRDWIEESTLNSLAKDHTRATKFGVIWKGLGFYWERVGFTNAPAFSRSIFDEEQSGDAIEVTYWLAAEALK